MDDLKSHPMSCDLMGFVQLIFQQNREQIKFHRAFVCLLNLDFHYEVLKEANLLQLNLNHKCHF